MSYIDLINQFWRMNRIEQFTPCEVCFYFYLLSQWNVKGRDNFVEIKTSVMFAELKMTNRTIYSARESLMKRGLITFTEGERRTSSPVYQILENVDIGRIVRTAEPQAETVSPEDIDEIPIPLEYQWSEPPEQAYYPEPPEPEPVLTEPPLSKKTSRKKVEKPLDELFKVPKPEKRSKKEFIPPTLQEVEDFFSGLGILNAEERAQQFFFHYDSLGWHTATGAVIWRWDSLANKWLLNDKQKEQQNENSSSRSSSKKGGEGDEYKCSLLSRFAESERKFREENGTD